MSSAADSAASPDRADGPSKETGNAVSIHDVSIYDERPWLARYEEGQPHDIGPEYGDALAMFRAGVERNPDGDAIRYFDGCLSYRELDELTDAFAAGLLDSGFAAGDRVALYLQNVPQFVVGLV